ASRLPGPVVGWPGGQGRCTTVCVVAVSSWVETSQTVPSLRAGLPPGLDGPVRGRASGGGVGALLGPEGTGPAFRPRVGWGAGGVFSGGSPVSSGCSYGLPCPCAPACVGVGWGGGVGGGAGRVVG